jgi:hypothetical protein
VSPVVFAAVLFGAACHAGWNAAIKVGLDTVLTTSLIAIGAGAVALVLLDCRLHRHGRMWSLRSSCIFCISSD